MSLLCQRGAQRQKQLELLFAVVACSIITAWPGTNKSWELIGQNRPLEAGWRVRFA
jgi:hypothetical protein